MQHFQTISKHSLRLGPWWLVCGLCWSLKYMYISYHACLYYTAADLTDKEVKNTVEVLFECLRNTEDNVELIEQICFALNSYVISNGKKFWHVHFWEFSIIMYSVFNSEQMKTELRRFASISFLNSGSFLGAVFTRSPFWDIHVISNVNSKKMWFAYISCCWRLLHIY